MKAKIGFKRLLTLALMLCMVLALCLPAFGAGTQDAQGNTAVEEDKSGVLQVVTGVRDKESGKFLPVQAGTGFLVNETNVVTCSHVAFFDYNDEETKKYITETLDLSEKQADERKEIHISVYRDQTIKATVVTHSDIADLAVLKMEQPLKNRTYLKVNTGEIKPTAPCYTLGFPGLVGAIIDKNTYTSDDVTVNFGMINRMGNEGTVSAIVHTAQMPGGCSGGPLVDYAGSVIGITQKAHSEDGTQVDYMSAIAVSELVSMMDPLGIEYTNITTPAEPVDDTDSSAVNKTALQNEIAASANPNIEGKDAAVVDEFNNAISNAQTVLNKEDATQEEVDAATARLSSARSALGTSTATETVQTEEAEETEETEETKAGGLQIAAIVAIIAAIIILIIVIVMLKPGKKQEAPAYGPGPDMSGFAAGSGPAPGYGPAGGFDSYAGKPETGTTVLGGAADTTVLGSDSNATTVLSEGENYGTLVRTKTGESIVINKNQFKIGRERSRVDYCISDNTAVGRLHAIIVNRGGSAYVVDQNSTNCTFVNSVRATANQEVRINSGDKITFADEEFTYNAF